MSCTKSLLPRFSSRPGVYKACSPGKSIFSALMHVTENISSGEMAFKHLSNDTNTLQQGVSILIFSPILFHFQLPPVEKCKETILNFCGDDGSKYPTEAIEDILIRNPELASPIGILKRYFRDILPAPPDENKDALDNLACKATKKTIPRYSRAKNVQARC